MWGQKLPKERYLILQDDHRSMFNQRKAKVRWWLWCSGVLLVAVLVSVAARAADVEKTHQLLLPEQAASGELLFKSDVGYRQAVHLDTALDVNISGMLAHLEIRQIFKNTTQSWQEAVYVLPLAENAAVNYMHLKIGDRVIVGDIKEKEAAKKIYQKAKASGKRAAIVNQVRANLFRQKVANIAPGQTIEVSLKMIQPVAYRQGVFSFRFPMTLTPRYFPGQPLPNGTSDQSGFISTSGRPLKAESLLEEKSASEKSTLKEDAVISLAGWSLPTKLVPDAHLISPLQVGPSSPITPQATIKVALSAGIPLAEVNSAYHDVVVKKHQGLHQVVTRNTRVTMDRDFVLHWRPVDSGQPQAAYFSEKIQGDEYGMLMILPPWENNAGSRITRDMTFIVDTSGSMGGESIRQAKSALLSGLALLGPEDRFNIVQFNTDYSSLFPEVRVANSSHLKAAREFVRRLQAGGGTQMKQPLEYALSNTPELSDEARVDQVIFITDGSVGNEAELMKVIHEKLNHKRLFTVGIGAAPNSYFMRKAAEFGRGSFTYIGDVSEVSQKMGKLFSQLSSPAVTNVVLDFPSPWVTDVWPKTIPDIYYGEPLLLAIKLNRETSGAGVSSNFNGDENVINVRGGMANDEWQQAIKIKSENHDRGVSSYWAREKIEDLMDQKILGMSEAKVKSGVLSVALSHKLVSAYTSFVAVEHETVRAPLESLKQSAVANDLPKGSAIAVPLPQTATRAELSFWWCAFISLVALFYFAVTRNQDLPDKNSVHNGSASSRRKSKGA